MSLLFWVILYFRREGFCMMAEPELVADWIDTGAKAIYEKNTGTPWDKARPHVQNHYRSFFSVGLAATFPMIVERALATLGRRPIENIPESNDENLHSHEA